MRALLNTNVVIHREATTVIRQDIGKVFFWLDKLKYEKCVHPVSLAEISKHQDEKVRATFQPKLQSYQVLKKSAPIAASVQQFTATDLTDNDKNDTLLINEVLSLR